MNQHLKWNQNTKKEKQRKKSTDLKFLNVGKEGVSLKHAELRVTMHCTLPTACTTLVLSVGHVNRHY